MLSNWNFFKHETKGKYSHLAQTPKESIASSKSSLTKLSEFVPVRYNLTIWGVLGLFVMYCLRVNMSVTLVSMVRPTFQSDRFNNRIEICPVKDENITAILLNSRGEFEWDEFTQGLIQGSLFYGYTISHFIGGFLVVYLGGKRLMGYGILFASSVTMLIPMAANLGPLAVVIMRIFVGLGLGVLTPSVYSLTSNWIPPDERATQLSLIFTGMQIGTIFMLPFSAWICELKFEQSWTLVFYISSLFGFVWWIGWNRYVYDTPSVHPCISKRELIFLQSKNESSASSQFQDPMTSTPWKKIFTSMPVWVIAVTSFASSWTFYTMLTELPNYLNHVLHASTLQNGFENSLIFLVQTVVNVGAGYLSDFITSVKIISRTKVRKLFETTALSMTALCLLAIPKVGCRHREAYVLILLSQAFLGLTAGGETPLPIDLAPDFSGPVSAMINGAGSMAGIAAPAFVGWYTNSKENLDGWNMVFYMAALICLIGNLIFLLLGTAETQSWGIMKDISQKSLVDIQEVEE